MNKRDAVLSLLGENSGQQYVPGGFFIHFDKAYQRGRPAIDKHLQYFRYTGMDFVKIQFEVEFPSISEIKTPADWEKFPVLQKDLFENQLGIVQGLVKEAKREALVIMTLYSPFMCARLTTSDEMITSHLREAPEKVKPGMERVTESLMYFVKECIRLGVDGFYTSTQGGETNRFENPACFTRYIKPYDLALMEEIDRSCIFNILHVCDFRGGYHDLTPFLDYPGHVISYGEDLGSHKITGKEISQMFGRPFMGGMNRKGIIASGNSTEIEKRVVEILKDAPNKFILGADCTLPSDVNWDNIQTAIKTAHEYSAGNGENAY